MYFKFLENIFNGIIRLILIFNCSSCKSIQLMILHPVIYLSAFLCVLKIPNHNFHCFQYPLAPWLLPELFSHMVWASQKGQHTPLPFRDPETALT